MTCIDCTQIKNALQDIYTLEQIDDWFDSPQKMLNGKTPTTAIAEGRYIQVLEIAKSLSDGNFL